jgi:hypothetical protein
MSVLMNAHPLIGPPLAELFMQVMFAPGVLTRSEREMVAAVAAADCRRAPLSRPSERAA